MVTGADKIFSIGNEPCVTPIRRNYGQPAQRIVQTGANYEQYDRKTQPNYTQYDTIKPPVVPIENICYFA